MGRLVETRKSGLFSHGGLLGRGDIELYGGSEDSADYEGIYAHQYDLYLGGETFNTYNLYGSQSGAQGMFFGALDLASPLTPADNLRIYRVIASLSFAVTISVLLLWFLNEFGWTTAVITLAGAIASPWLTFFGRNLFYFPTFFYIPIVAVTWYLQRNSTRLEQVNLKFGLLVFSTILLKCLFNGFDFILPSILMIGAPYVYFAMRNEWKMRKFIQAGLVITISVTAAVLFALVILSLQLWAHFDDLSRAVGYIASTFSRRTLGDPNLYPEYAASLRASTWEVLQIYFQGKSAVGRINLRFMDLFAIFAAFTGLYFLAEKLKKELAVNTQKARALIVSTWASIFSPLLWYIIFKGQSYVHTHTNFLSWYMPFVIYGFALCGYSLENLYLFFRKTGKAPE